MNEDTATETCYGERYAGRYLTFTLDAEVYGIPISVVQRIIHLQPITPVPMVPPAVLGVVNHQGRVLPIVDMKKCFEMGDFDHHEENCIVVLQVPREGRADRTLGILVERMHEVLPIEAGTIQPPPESIDSIERDYVLGLANLPDGIRILLDMQSFVLNQQFNSLAIGEGEDSHAHVGR